MPINRDPVDPMQSELQPGDGTSLDQFKSVQLATPAASFTGVGYLNTPGPGDIVNITTSVPQAEQHIAVDLNNPLNLMAGVSDFNDVHVGFNHTKYGTSIDGGLTWTEHYMPEVVLPLIQTTPLLQTGDGFIWLANSDPVIAVSKGGLVYMSNLYIALKAPRESQDGNGIYVSVANWVDPVFTADNTFKVARSIPPLDTRFNDKQWLAVDNSDSQFSGNVYHSWTRFLGSNNAIRFSRSIDEGKTWSDPVKLNLSMHDGMVQGSQIVVGPSGQVYVCYNVFASFGRSQLWFVRSLDGGRTWRAPHAVSPIFFDLNFTSSYRKIAFSAMSVDKIDGSIHIVYPDQPNSNNAQMNYIKSENGGVSFTSPVRINDVNAGQQFMPAIHVDQARNIHTCWYDTRFDPGDNQKYNIFATLSRDNGLTWGPNKRVTPSTLTAGNSTFIGDYTGVTADGGVAHPVWTSDGFDNGTLQTTRLLY